MHFQPFFIYIHFPCMENSNILPNISFWVSHKKENNSGLEQHGSDNISFFVRTVPLNIFYQLSIHLRSVTLFVIFLNHLKGLHLQTFFSSLDWQHCILIFLKKHSKAHIADVTTLFKPCKWCNRINLHLCPL